jgi:UDP-N-acetylmuramyl pentapeptide phosphotransferase/UDP-N-acetylglucosamine-1-phosphate transferase
MAEPLRLCLAFALAVFPAVALCRVVMALRVLDKPNEARKSEVHKVAVPTSGGIGFALAAIFAAQLLCGWRPDHAMMAIEAGGVATLLIGFYDDRFHLKAMVKMALLLVVCIGLVWFDIRVDVLVPRPGVVLPLTIIGGSIGSVLWLVVVINAVNFMDGANGLSMGMAAIASAGLSACCAFANAWDLALIAAALSGGLVGFLVWNIPGKLFAGDAGALFAGAMLGAISLALIRLQPDLLFVPPTLMLPWLTDVLLTLAWRARHRKPLFSAHRDHVYQIAMKAGLKHWQVSLIHAVWALNAAIFAVIGAVGGGWAPLVVFLVLLAISVWIHIRVRRSGEKAGLVGAGIP